MSQCPPIMYAVARLSALSLCLAVGCLPWGKATCESETWYVDLDGDGYGAAGDQQDACDPLMGYVDNKADCDDARADVHPGAIEVCDDDDVDEDCDGRADNDDDDATGTTYYYQDADEDGYGSENDVKSACELPEGYVSVAGDCDDTNSAMSPAREEMCGNGIDENCDGGGAGCGWGEDGEHDSEIEDIADVKLYGSSWNDGDDCPIGFTDIEFGITMANAGDIDGDGTEDLVVGAPLATFNHCATDHGSCTCSDHTQVGVVYLFESLASPATRTSDDADAIGYIYGRDDYDGEQLGRKPQSAGTFCDEGTGGVVVSAPFHNGGDGQVNVLCGELESELVITAGELESELGRSLAVIDIDSDGFDDLLATSTTSSSIHIYSGTGDESTIQGPEGSGLAFGCCKQGMITADVNYDGAVDLVIADTAAEDVGTISIFEGPINTEDGATISVEDATWNIRGEQADASFGTSIAWWDAEDGSGTLVIGADLYDGSTGSSAGIVYLVDDMDALEVTQEISTVSDAELLGKEAYDLLGYPLTAEGDFNADGYHDLVLAARGTETGSTADEGAIYVIYGPPARVLEAGASHDIDDVRDLRLIGPGGSNLGDGLAVLDANGDGIDDLAMGAAEADDYGRAFILFGKGY